MCEPVRCSDEVGNGIQGSKECSTSPRAAGSWVVIKARTGNTSSNGKRQAFGSLRVIDSQTIWKRAKKRKTGVL